MTELSKEEAEKRKESDRELASTAKKLLLNRKTPFFATLGVAIVFSIRTWACDYAEPYPDGLNFEWYGEHCGPGHGTGGEVIDELDEACKRHDEAYKKSRATGSGDVPMKAPLEN